MRRQKFKERSMSILKIEPKRSSVRRSSLGASGNEPISPAVDIEAMTPLERELYAQARYKGQDSADALVKIKKLGTKLSR